MHKKSGIALILAGLLAGCANQPGRLQGETLDLGDSQRVSRLFAYPNNCSVICYRDWTLEQTVEHYLQQSLTRDGYPQANVRVTRNGERIHAIFDGAPTDYGKPLLQLLDTGDLAYQGASQLNRDGKWQYNWYFFLPLGMALENRKSVELLHFPPDYSLTQAQDYLRSSTTDRWASLLSFNGVQPEHTPDYQTIVDIAPIAAQPVPAVLWKASMATSPAIKGAWSANSATARGIPAYRWSPLVRRCAVGSLSNTE